MGGPEAWRYTAKWTYSPGEEVHVHTLTLVRDGLTPGVVWSAAGMVFIHGIQAESADLPFGGIKRSGFGRELGRHGIEEFVNKKLIRTVT